MIRSMTGFGEATAMIDGVQYVVEVRSLNNKYFKSTIRLAEEYQGLEPEIESRLRSRINRGTVVVTARANDSSQSAAYTINTAALSRYLEQLRSLPSTDHKPGDVNIAQLLSLPGVLQPPLDGEDRFERARAAFMPLLDKAIDALIAMRSREGHVLAQDLQDHRHFIAQRLEQINVRAPGVIADYELRLKARIEALLAGAEARVQESDLIREIAVYAERTDIAEETKRLAAHLDQFNELLTASGAKPIGRTLDFLTQEMLREANTIASKSPDAEISRATVDIKGAIDRIKEQAANVE